MWPLNISFYCYVTYYSESSEFHLIQNMDYLPFYSMFQIPYGISIISISRAKKTYDDQKSKLS